jgi:superfamily II DNA/RNA helicase
MGAAQTGTGKTAAFTLPLLQKMMKHENASMSPARHPVRALVLAPTRELADQVAENVKKYAKHTQLRSLVVFGGIDMKPQTAELKAGVEVLIATPGRLLDHIEAKNCALQPGGVRGARRGRPHAGHRLPARPAAHPVLPAQAAADPAVLGHVLARDPPLAQSYLQDPVTVEVAARNATATNVEQRFYSVSDDDKRAVVRQLLRDRELSQAIVFVNSKLGAARLARSFERDGLKTAALHGDKSQDERLKALEAFKRGEVDLLVATDVAARGLDIADLPAVFNFDVPFNAEDYVHRIGRTGRAGASGLAVTLVDRDDTRLVATSRSSSRRSSRSSRSNWRTTVRAVPTSSVRPGCRRRSRRPTRSLTDLTSRALPSSQRRTLRRPATRPARWGRDRGRPTSRSSARWPPCWVAAKPEQGCFAQLAARTGPSDGRRPGLCGAPAGAQPGARELVSPRGQDPSPLVFRPAVVDGPEGRCASGVALGRGLARLWDGDRTGPVDDGHAIGVVARPAG